MLLCHLLSSSQVQVAAQQPDTDADAARAAAAFAANSPPNPLEWAWRLSTYEPWYDASVYWSSDHQHEHIHMRSLLEKAALGSRCLTIATLGGSSSATVPNFGHYLADGLRAFFNASGFRDAKVCVVNPSQGGALSQQGL